MVIAQSWMGVLGGAQRKIEASHFGRIPCGNECAIVRSVR